MVMINIIQKQLVEWREELSKQRQKQAQAQKVLQETNQSILLLEGGVQAKELLLKKLVESKTQPSNKEEQVQGSEPKPSK